MGESVPPSGCGTVQLNQPTSLLTLYDRAGRVIVEVKRSGGIHVRGWETDDATEVLSAIKAWARECGT